MALQINALEAVTFGDIIATPKLNNEVRLRLSGVKFDNEAEINKAQEVIASAFPEQQAQVLEYLRNNPIPVFELQRVQAYLLNGETAVKAFDETFDKAIDKALENGESSDV